MKNYLFIFLAIVFLISCSTAKQLNNKWVGKTDQEVVDIYGNPKSVFNDTLKGKMYYYYSIYPQIIKMRYVSKDVVEPADNQNRTYEKTIFHFDSLNKVTWVEYKDSTYKLLVNIYKK